MKILVGECGGLIIRADETHTKFYYWLVCLDGTNQLSVYKGDYGSSVGWLQSPSSPNYHQTNLLTVVAKGHSMYFYVNKQEVDSATDGTFSRGQIGVIADDFHYNYNGESGEDVAYTNAQVWTL